MVRPLRALGRASVLVPLGLFLLALLLRLIGVDWHGTHPDEDIGGPARVLAGDLRLHNLYYPPLLTYLVAIADVPLYAVGRLLGWWHSAAGFRDAYFGAPTSFYVTARIVVAVCSATAAPLGWAIARQLRLSERAAILTGLVCAILPGAIYWSHVAKSDSGIGPAFLLVLLAVLRLRERPGALGRAALVGLAAALAVSFKQSAVFFLAPMLALFALWSLRPADRRGAAVRGWAVALGAAIVGGAILNLPILIDPKPFLAAQAVQSQMSFRSASLAVTIRTCLEQLVSPDVGLPAVVLAAMAALWAVGIARGSAAVRLLLTIVAAGWLVAAIVICSIAGSRQPPHLWLPYIVLAAFAATLACGALIDSRRRMLELLGYGGIALLCVGAVVRTVPILSQALTPPIGTRVAAAVRSAAAPGAKIASNVELGGYLPVSPESQTLPRARNERLAARYGIVLPPPDRPVTGVPGGYTVLNYAWVIGGLEGYRPDQVKVVLPYAWPLQPDEWQLGRWLAQGFRVFVVQGAAQRLGDPVPAYRDFFRALDRCPRVATLPTTRLLYGEQETRIYRCG